MLGRFMERSRRVVVSAAKEAGRHDHGFVGAEHILLGIILDGGGVACTVLQRLGLRLESVKAELERVLAAFPESPTSGQLPFTPEVKRVFELAVEQAQQLGNAYIGTEQLLLGLMKEGQSKAAQVIESLGMRLDEVRQEILVVIGARIPNSEDNLRLIANSRWRIRM